MQESLLIFYLSLIQAQAVKVIIYLGLRANEKSYITHTYIRYKTELQIEEAGKN
jgi:hypothetical protein